MRLELEKVKFRLRGRSSSKVACSVDRICTCTSTDVFQANADRNSFNNKGIGNHRRSEIETDKQKKIPQNIPYKNTDRVTQSMHRLHDLILSDARRGFRLLHHLRSRSSIQVLNKGDAQGTTTVLVTGELSCTEISISLAPVDRKYYDIQMAVSAVSAVSN